MTGLIELNLTLLQELRCSMCQRYLSCSPIQVLPDGNSACGRCFNWRNEHKSRSLTLEALASKLSFPCEFSKNGCKERVAFNLANEHESKCAYRSYMCPILPGGICQWAGSALQIYEHILQNHLNVVKEKLEFTLQVSQDKQEFLLAKVGDIIFTMKYLFTASKRQLAYDIRYITTSKQEALWKIQVTNSADHDYKVSTKGGKCLPFNIHFYDKLEVKTFSLASFLQVLNNPECVVVVMDLQLIKLDQDDKQLLPLDTNLLLSLRCKGCQCYLLPPIYDCKKGIVCGTCKSKFSTAKPTHNEKLKALVAKTNFPCRWRGCGYVQKGELFGDHELICPHRIYECINTNKCKDTFKRDTAAVHLESHGYVYFADSFVYKVVFQQVYSPHTIFTFKNNEVVSVVRETSYDREASEYRHYLSLNNMNDANCVDICVRLQVHHEHCKIKSKVFVLRSSCKRWFVNMGLLPDCFRMDEELTFTVAV